jgi:hypothetical protein
METSALNASNVETAFKTILTGMHKMSTIHYEALTHSQNYTMFSQIKR